MTASYGVEFFLPRILENWYELTAEQADLGWCSSRPSAGWSASSWSAGARIAPRERRLHGSVPIYLGAAALVCTLLIPTSLSFNCGWLWR